VRGGRPGPGRGASPSRERERALTGPSTVTAVLVLTCLPAAPAAAQGSGALPELCRAEAVVSLSPLRPFRAAMERGGGRCLSIEVEAGEQVRAVFEIEAIPPLTGAALELFAPGDTAATLRVGLGNLNRHPVTWTAATTGLHHLVVRDVWSLEPTLSTIPVRVWIEAVEPAALVRARREALAADARVAWLAEHAMPVRSIAPDDDDFEDLEPLRESLEGVRLVLLGEGDHYSGTDIEAKSRLVRFLHREMGFDLLAFESSTYGMAVAWDSIRSGAAAKPSFALGAWPFWAGAAQMQPLIDYIEREASGDRPLEVAGFDVQFIRPGSGEHFAGDVADFLEERGIGGVLADRSSPEWGVLESLGMIRYKTGEEAYPDAPLRRSVLRALDEATARVAELEDDRARLWAEILRSTGAEARMNFDRAEGASIQEAARHRNARMGERLVWLADERHPGRKIIAWAGSAHLMRLPDIPPAAGVGPSMGQRVWEALGRESFVFVTTYLEGANAVTDQHALADFEQLMVQAGFEYGVLDLRRAAEEGSWAGGAFFARPLIRSEEAVWSDAADALFFIRRDERTRPAPP
jgi:erythromycin esterase